MANVSGGDAADKALEELAAKLGEGLVLRVGFLEDSLYPDGTPVAMVAAVNNFGAPSNGIPPRPFFSNTVKDGASEWGPQMAAALKARFGDGRAALALMGAEIKGQIQDHIQEMDAPPNSPVTNLLKFRFPKGGQTFADVLAARRDVAAGITAPAGKPLVQSGDMLQSVDWDITP